MASSLAASLPAVPFKAFPLATVSQTSRFSRPRHRSRCHCEQQRGVYLPLSPKDRRVSGSWHCLNLPPNPGGSPLVSGMLEQEVSPRRARHTAPKIKARVLPELAAQRQAEEEEEARKPNSRQTLLDTQARVLQEIQTQLHSKGNGPTPTDRVA